MAPVSLEQGPLGTKPQGDRQSRTNRLRRSEERKQQGGRWEVRLQSAPWAGDTGTETLKALGFRGAAQSARGGGPDLSRAWGAHSRASSTGRCRRVGRDTPQGLASGPRVAHCAPPAGSLQAASSVALTAASAQLTGSSPTPAAPSRQQPWCQHPPRKAWTPAAAGGVGRYAGKRGWGRLGLSPLPQPPKQQGAEPRGKASFHP